MKTKTKKGFTLVELVIVIAVIAILAAVLIPTFSNIVRSAQKSSDTTLVRNLNTALQTSGEKHETMTEALEAAKEAGYDVSKINASATNNEILWDSVNDVFVYLDDSEKVYIPDSVSKNNQVKDDEEYKFWKIYDEMPSIQDYSIYLRGEKALDEQTISVGFDAGENVTTSVSYASTKERNVTIRTNGGTLNVNAASATVNHYGILDNANIESVADHSYYENGEVKVSMNVKKGHVVVSEKGEVNEITLDESSEGNLDINGKVNTVVVDSKDANVNVSSNANVNNVIADANANVTGAAKTQKTNVSTYDALVQALNVESVKYIVLENDITLSSCINITRDLVIDGQNKTLTTDSSENKTSGRAINIGFSNDVCHNNLDVTLKNIKIQGPTEGSSTRGVNIAGSNNKVTLTNCEITCKYYPVNFVIKCENANVKIDSSTINGWCAFNIWGNDNYIEVSNSKLTGTNSYSSSSNDFATVVFEANTKGDTSDYGYNNYVKIIKSEINATKEGSCEQWLVSYHGVEGVTARAMNCTTEIIDSKLDYPSGELYANSNNSNHLLIDGEEQIK